MSTHATHTGGAQLIHTFGVLAVVIGMMLTLVPGISSAAHSIGDIGPGEFEIDGDKSHSPGSELVDAKCSTIARVYRPNREANGPAESDP